ncbi:LEA type 2 family protein [Leadbettera azotonutricia]|nr:LEA type 2 family protein [Leadbettera azotonutricia]
MSKTFLYAGISAVLFLAVFNSCKSPPPPPPAEMPKDPRASIFLEGIEAQGVNSINLAFVLKAENPRSESAAVTVGVWSVLINNRKVDEGVRILPEASGFNVDAASDAEVPVKLELDIAALTRAGLTLKDDYHVSIGTDLEFVYDAGMVKVTAGGDALFPRIQEPVFAITAIAILKAELINTRFRVSLKVENPNPFPMDLSSFKYELYGEGRFWADGQERNVLKIPAHGAAETRLFLVMNFIDMKRDLFDLIVNLQDVNYRFKGEALVKTEVDYLPQFRTAFDLSGYSQVFDN